MTDTAQPATAAETVVASDPFAAGAHAFKVALGQAEERPRDASGRFASQAPAEAAEAAEEEVEIEAPGKAEQAEPEAESQDEEQEADEAADEAQPEAVALPTSWPAEHAETWKALPPETQAIIAEREGQRDAAVNAKFQEAANVRKANEAVIMEANANRQRYAEGLNLALSVVQIPAEPSITMLDVNSGDYDPDTYHLHKAQRDNAIAWYQHLSAQQQQLTAQDAQMGQYEAAQRFHAIESASRDAFLADVPEVKDQAKANAVFRDLAQYALKCGAPQDMFESPVTALEWHMLWKAQEYDRLQSAKARVSRDPRPEPRKAQPAVRPGVTTPRSAVERANRGKDLNRLATEGSVQAGAAVWKHFLK